MKKNDPWKKKKKVPEPKEPDLFETILDTVIIGGGLLAAGVITANVRSHWGQVYILDKNIKIM